MKRERFISEREIVGYKMETYTDYEVISPLIEKVLKGLEQFLRNLSFKVYRLHSKYNIKEVQKEREVAVYDYVNSDY